MLPEEVIKDCSIFFVNSLHLIDVLGNSLHTYQGLHQMLLLIRVGCCQRFELKKQWIYLLIYQSWLLPEI